MNNTSQVAFGQLGSAFATGTGSITIPSGKTVVAITALAAAKLDSSTAVESGFDKPTNAVAIPAGCTIYGRFTEVVLDEGSIMAYFG
tara:strand:+ start:9070 stop:9330 length:261 start_codon:yes stop_codon:yes gene_type:complete